LPSPRPQAGLTPRSSNSQDRAQTPQSQKHRVRPALKACNAISAVAGIGFDNVQSQTGNPTLAAMPNVGKNATCGGAGNVRKYILIIVGTLLFILGLANPRTATPAASTLKQKADAFRRRRKQRANL
jgi:hypothetical protein